MVSKVNGIVIKEFDAGENGKRVIVLTREHGKMSLFIRGAKTSKKGMQAVQLFSCCEFTIFEGRGFYSVTNVYVIESFYGIRNDFKCLTYASFILEVTERVSFEELDGDRIFELLFRTLSVLAGGKSKPRLVSAVFILRLLKEYGFMSGVSCCPSCGAEIEEGFYTVWADGIYCAKCASEGAKKLDRGAVRALRHITESSMKKIFAFDVSDAVLEELWKLAMAYRKEYLGEKYNTLGYIESMNF